MSLFHDLLCYFIHEICSTSQNYWKIKLKLPKRSLHEFCTQNKVIAKFPVKWITYAFNGYQFCLNPKAGSSNLKTIMYLKQHQYEEVDITTVPFKQLVDSIGKNLVERHSSLIGTAKQLPVLAIVREPLVRFLASYKDKIQR